jgi:F420 biosynthesis protein FbiB-like protein
MVDQTHLLPDIIVQRQSVRRFQDTPVPTAVCNQILEAAALAPSAHGRQPWAFVVVGVGTPRQHLIAEMATTWHAHLAADGTDAAHIQARIDASAQRIQQAPLLIMPCIDTSVLDVYPDPARQQAEMLMAVQSIGCAIQNMLLCAVHLGLSGGWMCAPLFCQDAARRALGLADTLAPQALIPFGYMHTPPKRRPKRSASQLRIDIDTH